MSPEEHKADVAVVLAEAPCLAPPEMVDCEGPNQRKHPECVLAALTAAGIACVYVPKGVGHGARLVTHTLRTFDHDALYTIEDTP